MKNSDFSSVTEIVPQISYEIIGRIIPGVIIILSLIVVAMGPTQAVMYLDETVIHSDHASSGGAVVLIIIAAYILAFVLDGVWQIPACVRRRGKEPYQPDLRAPSTSLKFDIVNQELPKAGAWLIKLYAETNTTQVLIIGWVVSAAINVYFLMTAFSIERLWLEIGLVASTIGAVAVRNSITATREDSLENLWIFLQERTSAGQDKNTAEER
jgi:hypothetical protein